VWQFTRLAGFGPAGYIVSFLIAVAFFLVYWFSYGRSAGTAFKAVLPLFGVALLAAPFHLLGLGGLTAAMLFYTLLPGAGMMLALWGVSGLSFNE
jgi:hypothetical protein